MDCNHDFLERVDANDAANGVCAICLSARIAELERELDEAMNVVSLLARVFERYRVASGLASRRAARDQFREVAGRLLLDAARKGEGS